MDAFYHHIAQTMTTCFICLDDETTSPLINCCNCNNYSHTDCLKDWLLVGENSAKRCPSCLQPYKAKIVTETSLRSNQDTLIQMFEKTTGFEGFTTRFFVVCVVMVASMLAAASLIAAVGEHLFQFSVSLECLRTFLWMNSSVRSKTMQFFNPQNKIFRQSYRNVFLAPLLLVPFGLVPIYTLELKFYYHICTRWPTNYDFRLVGYKIVSLCLGSLVFVRSYNVAEVFRDMWNRIYQFVDEAMVEKHVTLRTHCKHCDGAQPLCQCLNGCERPAAATCQTTFVQLRSQDELRRAIGNNSLDAAADKQVRCLQIKRNVSAHVVIDNRIYSLPVQAIK